MGLHCSNTIQNIDVHYSLSGKNVDAVIIDTGNGDLILQQQSFQERCMGTYRAKDLILDGPYKIDPDYFTTNNHTW